MDSMYVDMSASSDTEMMMLKAVSEPREIRQRRTAKREDR